MICETKQICCLRQCNACFGVGAQIFPLKNWANIALPSNSEIGQPNLIKAARRAEEILRIGRDRTPEEHQERERKNVEGK